ncbi:MAG TPA: twin-arginine translocase subunit TatC, partial [Kiritimatiellia bacterium]|nr:twin-arginine translocase subunit TatC [Kiritimatiellia bacterium]
FWREYLTFLLGVPLLNSGGSGGICFIFCIDWRVPKREDGDMPFGTRSEYSNDKTDHFSANPSAMSFGAHLDELRLRLGQALGGFVVAFIASLSVGKWFAGVILSPYKVAMEAAGIEVRLQAVQPAEPFLVYMKAAMVLAALISSPWVFYQLWAFISAGLHKHERRYVHMVAPASAALFAVGVLFFLLVIAPWVFKFFMKFDLGIDYLTYQPGVGKTADFILVLALVFGIAFQTPIAIVFAERMGLVSFAALCEARKYVFLGTFVIGAVLTPPDVISQVALAVPLYILYEGGLLVCRFWQKKRKIEPSAT